MSGATFPCGCTELRAAGEATKHWIPPDPDCVVCQGTGRIRDKQHLPQRNDRYFGPDDDDATDDDFLIQGGWHIETVSTAGDYGRFVTMSSEEIAREVHKAAHALRKATSKKSIARATTNLVRLLDELWGIELDKDTQLLPASDVVVPQAVLWSDSDGYAWITAVSRLIEDFGWNQPPVRRKPHASPDERTRVLWLFVVGKARGLSDRACHRMVKAVTGVSRSNVQRWVAHFAKNRPLPLTMKGSDMSDMTTLAEDHADLKERVSELEKWVGLPVGGKKAVEATVDRWISESLSEPTHESDS